MIFFTAESAENAELFSNVFSPRLILLTCYQRQMKQIADKC